jgi:hypothetical protein
VAGTLNGAGLTPSSTQFDDIPSSAQKAFEAVLRDATNWGLVWMECVTTFVEFERVAGFKLQDHQLPTSSHRLRQLPDWFKHGRKLLGQVWDDFSNGDPDAFGESWSYWWSDIQPPG